MNLTSVIVSILSLLIAAYTTYKIQVLGAAQRKLQERLMAIEEGRNRDEKRDRWLKHNPLPVIYAPMSGVDGYKVSVCNQGGADAAIALNVNFIPPEGEYSDRFSHGTRPQIIKAGKCEFFDITQPMEAYQNNSYSKSLRAEDRMTAHKYLQLHAYVVDGPKADAYIYGTERGGWVRAGWEVVREIGGGERVEAILPPPTD